LNKFNILLSRPSRESGKASEVGKESQDEYNRIKKEQNQ